MTFVAIRFPAVLGMFLLWGNKKRHVIWIIAGSMILLLSIGWVPLRRLMLPMIALMMAFGWATYFFVMKIVAKWLRQFASPEKTKVSPDIVAGFFVLEIVAKWLRRFIPSEKTEFSSNIVAGLLVCCLAIPIITMSAISIHSGYKKGAYPYHDAAWDGIDMGEWLRENASSDTITMTTFPWDLHFYSDQPAIQIPRTSLEKAIEVMRFYMPKYIILDSQIDTRPSLAFLKPLVTGEVPGLKQGHDNKELKLYNINYALLPE